MSLFAKGIEHNLSHRISYVSSCQVTKISQQTEAFKRLFLLHLAFDSYSSQKVTSRLAWSFQMQLMSVQCVFTALAPTWSVNILLSIYPVSSEK